MVVWRRPKSSRERRQRWTAVSLLWSRKDSHPVEGRNAGPFFQSVAPAVYQSEFLLCGPVRPSQSPLRTSSDRFLLLRCHTLLPTPAS